MLTGVESINQEETRFVPELILGLQKWPAISEEKKESKKTAKINLSPRVIMSMVRAKIASDLFRFRTCCTDAQASR